MKTTKSKELTTWFAMKINELKSAGLYVKCKDDSIMNGGCWMEGGVYEYFGVFDEMHYVYTDADTCTGLTTEEFESIFE